MKEMLKKIGGEWNETYVRWYLAGVTTGLIAWLIAWVIER